MPRKNEIIQLAGEQYTLLKNIGNGGSGTVWSATKHGKTYALKIIASENKNKILRFEREIAFCQNTTHKNVVKVIAEGQYEGKPCYVMPCYAKTFREIINNENDPYKLFGYILEICKGIRYIHAKGIIHRDLKPENILINDSVAVLADFGIAHFKENILTNPGDFLANRNYMAPEQKIKNNANNIEGSVDIYALGMIINESFTKQNPGGSRHALIADSHPVLNELDRLISNMMRQNPLERPDIITIETELKFIFGKSKASFREVKAMLRSYDRPVFSRKPPLNAILDQATEDILTGKHLFLTASKEEFKQYNQNWHMNIGYKVSDFLLRLYVQEQIYRRCKGKFEYESSVYRKNNWYNTLDLDNNLEHKSLYQEMGCILEQYKLSDPGESLFDLRGQILKYFSACADYHCKEILKAISEIEKLAKHNLKDAPILWIVGTLKHGLGESMGLLLEGIDGLGGQYEFKFDEHIQINWDRAEYFQNDGKDEDFFDQSHLEKEKEEQKTLVEFQKKWGIRWTIIDQETCSIKFNSYSKYLKFKRNALDIARPHYIFEGDVLDIFRNPNFIGNIVEIQVSRVFAIPHTLAKLVGTMPFDS